MSRYLFLRWCLAVFLACAGWFDARAAKIVLIAGPITGHPKEAHEYEKVVVLLKEMIETSPNLGSHPQLELHFNGWPTEPRTLDDADSIVMVGDGGDHREQDHPLYVGDRRDQFARQMKRGCGCVFLHWSTFHPSRFHQETTEWAGGYFDYETGEGANHWYSAIQTWNAIARPVAGHPISRGLRPYQTPEEFYYRIKFREPDSRLSPILVTRPPGESTDFAVAWAVERENGGRGFGTTGGHFFTNYWQPDFRKMVLNAIAWSAHLEVPANGVESEPLKRVRVLLVTGANHPAHDWRAVTAALVPVLEQDPRFVVTVTENPEELAKPGILSPYDLVVWNYVNWERAGLSASARGQFLEYLHRGGGLSLVHFAASAFHPSIPGTTPADAWPEWSEKIAARVWEHRPPSPSGHDSFGPFEVHPTGLTHPITQGLAAFPTEDELYFHQAGTVAVEPLVTAHSKVTGGEEPLAWAYNYEKARVFETVLGHSDVSIRAAARLIRRGSVWAAGLKQLGFDPPTEGLAKTLWREGSQWTPAKSAARAAAPSVTPQVPTGKLPTNSTPAPSTAPTPSPTANPAPESPQVPAPGTPKVSGRDASTQGEADWVDNRWQQTDVGPFLASNLRLPDTTIAKGLSIQVGNRREGAVAYDLESGIWRAAWAGRFLEFDPGRFGLIGPPRLGGNLLSLGLGMPTWPGSVVHYEGLRRTASRVILHFTVDGTQVLESPGLRTTPGGAIFLREFQVAPHSHPMRLHLSHALVDPTQVDPLRVPETFRNFYPDAQVFGVLQHPGDSAHLAAVAVRMWPPGGGPMAVPWTDLEESTNAWTILVPPSERPQEFVAAAWTARSGSGDPSAVIEQMHALAFSNAPAIPDWLTQIPRRWPDLITHGQLGATNDLLAVDTLTLPYDNPSQALLFASGIDFGMPGEAFICTIHGDVWRVTGIDDSLKELKWQRFATGLFQPLGLKVRDGKVLVLGRDRITRLHDLNNDGEADEYESLTDSIATSTGGHDYVTCLEADARGNLYYTDPRGVHRVSPDGRTNETVATGWRNPNGMGVRADGLITVAPQQGTWTPSSQISEVRKGGYYGFPGPQVSAERPLGYDEPLCWIPHSVDNSSGSQVWLPEGVWGPLGGHMLHLKWGRCGLMAVLRDTVQDRSQGAVFNLPVKFLSGPNRASFNPRDGALYVAGSTGWQTSAIRDGSLQRVRWLGRKTLMPVAWHARTNGLEITFNEPLRRETAEDVGSYGIQQWNYRYSSDYGSKDWSVAKPDQEGHDEVAIKSVQLSADGRTVRLETDPLKPVMQMELKWNLDGTDGVSSRQQMWLTLNRLDAAFPTTR